MNYNNPQEYIGKYINQALWSDVNPIGKILATKGKSMILIQPVKAGENLVKMEYYAGGFAGHCYNQRDQKYDFQEYGEPYWVRLSKTGMKRRFWYISDEPRKFYDYNF